MDMKYGRKIGSKMNMLMVGEVNKCMDCLGTLPSIICGCRVCGTKKKELWH